MTTLNERAHKLCDTMVADAAALGISVSTLDCGTRIVDCGVKSPGSKEAGRRLAEICMAGLGSVQIIPANGIKQDAYSWFNPGAIYPGLNSEVVSVHSEQPVAACMASQYAGWQITGEKFLAMGSGPMRAAACREEIFKTIGHCERPHFCVGVLETSKIPPDDVCLDLADKCGIRPTALTLLVARTSSPAGTVQIVARSVETALHKLHELGFNLDEVARGFGWAPIPPIASDDLVAIGWTNDAILYGGYVLLDVTADETTIAQFGPKVPSSASPDYGQPFAEIFKRYNNDFYKIDPMLFSPAMVAFGNAKFSRDYGQFGKIAPQTLAQSFAKK
jgi:methenyltetrahydromethanopterin cyclohydrolase